MGNRAKSWTERDIRAKTWRFRGRREARRTDAKMAALIDKESGNSTDTDFVDP